MGRLTTWTTDNDFASATPTCEEDGCVIKEHACTQCRALAYVTASPDALRRQAAAVFRRKLKRRNPPPPHLVHTIPNSYGEPIAHLVDTTPATSRLAHPSHASIHALLHPRTTSEEVRRHLHDVMDPPSLEAFLVFLNKQKGLSAPGPSKFHYCLLLWACPPPSKMPICILSLNKARVGSSHRCGQSASLR